jgi:carbon-monoxide dehydrogenase large subunit
MDPAELRRRNLVADDAYPYKAPTGLVFEGLSHHRSLTRLLEMMDYERLRREQAAARKRGVWRGIGLASFIEVTNPSAAFYGVGGARISSQDGCTIRLDPGGTVTCAIGVTEQGQGTEAMVAQIAAETLGLPLDRVRVVTGDTETTPYGGGTWASRGAGIGGEATLQSAKALKRNILEVAGVLLQAAPDQLDMSEGRIVDRASGADRMPLEELGRIAYFRPDTLPRELQPEFVTTRHYVQKDYAFVFTNGHQASHVEVDPETGFVRLLDHWCVEDCGRIISPLLVDEQIRGGVAQGIGAALWEECIYDSRGQLLNGTMADYLVPMAGEMPDIHVAHVETPTASSELGAKGAGEAGTAGAPAAVMNAINDALAPLGAKVARMPFTPERILAALGKIDNAQ